MRAFIFPGEGSRQVGLGKELLREFSAARLAFQRADDALGFSLSKLCFEGPADALMLAANSQPAILTMSTAVLWVLERETSLRPDIVAGHSLGEYTALVCAGALDFEDAVSVVRMRGELMQRSVPVGESTMAAIIGMSEREVVQLCIDAAQGETLVPANFNSPQQTVVAGHVGAVDRAITLAVRREGFGKTLPVSAAFHCPLMQRAADEFSVYLQRVVFKTPTIPIVSNVDAAVNVDRRRIPGLLVRQMTKPVLWTDCVDEMARAGVSEFVEVGPGGNLTRLLQQRRSAPAGYPIGTVEQIRRASADFPPRRDRISSEGVVTNCA